MQLSDNTNKVSGFQGFIALSPLILFVLLYLVTSIIANDFYKVPITVAFLFSCIFAITISTKHSLNERIKTFCKGAGNENMIIMILIFILAGAFASSAKAMGSIDATVNLTLSILPGNMLLAGLFLASCFISMSIGTSVGTIVALTPIATGIAESIDTPIALIVAIVVGGSFFGDNLSFISDTTIAATRTQDCKMSDKFRANIFIVAPAALFILGLYIFLGRGIESPHTINDINFLKVLPYLVVLITAAFGMNVMTVLTIGLCLTGIIGLCDGSYDFYGWFGSMGEGVIGVGELIIITMMAGGLMETIKTNGGINFLIQKLTLHVNSKRGAELTIAFLVSIINTCTANNTVAILTVGGIAKQVGDRFGVDSRKAASILDTFSCCMQGLIPYGAQLLMAAGLAKINPVEIIPYLYYPMIVGGFALLTIIFRFPKRYS